MYPSAVPSGAPVTEQGGGALPVRGAGQYGAAVDAITWAAPAPWSRTTLWTALRVLAVACTTPTVT